MRFRRRRRFKFRGRLRGQALGRRRGRRIRKYGVSRGGIRL